LSLGVKAAVGGRDIPIMESIVVEESVASDEAKEQVGRRMTEAESEKAEQEATEPESEEQDKISVPERVNYVKPVVKLNGEEGELSYGWECREVFRQDDKEWEERRMERLHSVDGGYIYEEDGILYFLDKNFQNASPLCDLCQLLGDSYLFSPATFHTCDVTADASRMLICTDEGLL